MRLKFGNEKHKTKSKISKGSGSTWLSKSYFSSLQEHFIYHDFWLFVLHDRDIRKLFCPTFFLSKTKQKTLLWIKNLCPVDQPNLCKVRFRSFEMFENSFFSRKWKQLCICIYRKSYRKIFDTILQLNMKSYPISFIHLKKLLLF